jgi:peptidylprolyl isomerase
MGLLSACGGGSSTAAEEAKAKGLPTVTGSYGDKPKIKVAKGDKPAKTLKSTVLKEGDGPKVAKGDLLVADYLGSIYRSGKVFDNSYDRKSPAAFPIGVGKVVAGWDKALVGVKTGSRVLMVLPPKEGYGAQGNPQVGIKGTDSLVFVVDVIASYNEKTAPDAPEPVSGLPKTLPTVTGDPGTPPKVAIPKGAAPPKKGAATTLATGSGEKVAKGELVVVQFAAVSWEGKELAKTWGDSPQGFSVGVSGQQANPFDLLIGTPVGSRVLLTLPAQEGGAPEKDSVAVVVDILAQNGTAKMESSS